MVSNKILPLVVITGPTASGKTALAVSLAKEYGGEIICADSRTIYKYMDIGTAKPDSSDLNVVQHWGVDLVEPGEYFSAADFKAYANQKIDEIRARGKIPFLVGGTGLYIDAVLFDYKFGNKADEGLRSKLQRMSVEELQDFCKNNNIDLPENDKNKRYLIRAIEIKDVKVSKKGTPIDNCIVVGISTEKDVLRTRIMQRSKQIFDSGVIEESIFLSKKYGWDSEAMKSNIYPLMHKYLDGDMTIYEVQYKFEIADWRLAKRQIAWLKRNKYINWLSLGDASKFISEQLAIHV